MSSQSRFVTKDQGLRPIDHRAHNDVGMAWRSDAADDHQVDRRFESPRDLGRN
jgi:hypothetical protein